MSTKERILEAVRQMPDTASFDEIVERLLLIEELNEAIRELELGQGLSHEEAKKRILAM